MTEPLQHDKGTGALRRSNADRIMENLDWAVRNMLLLQSRPWNPLRSIGIWFESRRRMRETWLLMISNERLRLQEEAEQS